MDKPQVGRIEGSLPAIASDQTNPVRSSRSTVGTMTELNDHLKLLFARGAKLYCRGCGTEVRRDTPDSVAASLAPRTPATGAARLVVTFPTSSDSRRVGKACVSTCVCRGRAYDSLINNKTYHCLI